MKNTIGRLTTYTAAAILLGFGLVYLLRNSFMPYHSEAISLEWDKVEPATQYLFLALMRATSGGFIATAGAIIFLQYKLQENKLSWIPLLILILGTISMLCTLYAILTVCIHTPGRPPFATDLIGEALLIVGFVFNRRYLLKQKSG
ncbi:MAG: hypothetical protein WCP32_11275 [Bacteroidota bacterium]